MQPQSYVNIIAGAVPLHAQGLVDDTALMMAREALGTDQVHVILSQPIGNRVLYFALPSKSLASEHMPVSQIAAALPGHPNHKGEGVYVLNVSPYKVAAVYYDEALQVLCNDAALIDDYVLDLGQPAHVVDNCTPWRFESAYTLSKARANRIERTVMRISAIVTAVACLSLLGFSVAAGTLANVAQRSTADFEASLQQAVNEIRTSSPLAEQLATLQSKTSTVVRAGGWVDYYEVKNGRESFRMYMPSWISRDYVQAMGEEVKTDLTAQSETLVQMVKGTPPAEDIKKGEGGQGGQGGHPAGKEGP